MTVLRALAALFTLVIFSNLPLNIVTVVQAEDATSLPAPAPAAAAPDQTLPAVPVPQFPGAQSKLDAWKETLDRAETALRSRAIADTTLSYLRDQTATAQSGVRDLITAVAPRLDAATARAAELAPNTKDPTPQSDAIKLERAKLQAEITARQSVVQQAKLINVRTQQTLDRISERRRTMFADTVLERSESLINPSFWIKVAANVPAAAGRLVDMISDWGHLLASQPLRAASGFLITTMVLLGFFLSPGRRWLARWTTRDPDVQNPSPLRKAGSATVIAMTGVAIPGIALLVLYQALMALGLLPPDLSGIVRALFIGITFAFFFIHLTRAVLAPERPSWRLIGLEDAAVDGMVSIAAAIGIVVTVGLVLDATNTAINAPDELSVASQGVVAIATAFLFMIALRIAAGAGCDDDESDNAPQVERSAWRLLIPAGWIVAAATLLGPLGGYVALGRFASGEMLVIVVVLMTVILLSRFADAAITAAFAFHGRIGRILRQTTGLSSATVRQIAALLYGFVQLALIAIAAFLLLATWGIHSDDIVGSMSSAFFGFSIGKFTISPSAILGAFIVLIIGMFATRALQRWLDVRLLPETNLDLGVRASIRTGVGYIGVILAAIVALSYVGLNLQNIAIVAGALSVGIGFGLQSIINNFVSGLILLVERPIKVGDRIEVGTRMGVVKRINVRSTEIVTYDNLSVIVPNAELISGQVVNWMHGSFSARLSVMVGTSYDADPDMVIAILLDIVGGHPRALKTPEPFAILGNFGADALEFTVFFHVGNIGLDAGVANDVRLEILKRFRTEGIEIPFAQRDLHFRDLDRLEALLREIGSNRHAKPLDTDN
jgi:small-conductance mechanosensitive channel